MVSDRWLEEAKARNVGFMWSELGKAFADMARALAIVEAGDRLAEAVDAYCGGGHVHSCEALWSALAAYRKAREG